MSQLRAKQIKLVAAGDLIVGGTNGNGSILTIGTAKQFLRVSSSGALEYADLKADQVTFDKGESTLSSTDANAAILEVNSALEAYKTLNDAAVAQVASDLVAEEDARIQADSILQDNIDTVDGRVTSVTSDLALEIGDRESGDTALGLRIDAVNTAAGITGDAYGTITGSNYLNDSISFRDADLRLDAALKEEVDARIAAIEAVEQSVASLGSAFNYVGTLEGGADAASALDLSLQAETDAGDYYKVTAAGYFKVGTEAAFFANVGDGLVFNINGGVDKIDNTNSEVQGTTNRVSVTGSTDTGFVVDIDAGYVGQSSITTLGTITTGTWSANTIAIAKGGTGLTSVGAANTVLTSDGSALAYNYVGALRDSYGFAGLELGSVDTGKLVVSSTGTEVKLAASGATNADLILAPAGNGKVIIGEAGAAVLESDDGQKLTLKANGADLVLSGSQVKADDGYVVTDALSFTTKSYVDTAISTAVAEVTVAEKTDELAAVGGETTISLTETPIAGTVKVFFNGMKLRAVTHYTVSGTTVTLVTDAIGYTVEEGDILEAVYNYASA